MHYKSKIRDSAGRTQVQTWRSERERARERERERERERVRANVHIHDDNVLLQMQRMHRPASGNMDITVGKKTFWYDT